MAETDDLAKLFNNPKYSDLTVKCGEKSWYCHRAILCSRCRFFEAACDSGFKESIEGVVVLDDDDPVCVERMLKLLYTLENERKEISFTNFTSEVRYSLHLEKYGLSGLAYNNEISLREFLDSFDPGNLLTRNAISDDKSGVLTHTVAIALELWSLNEHQDTWRYVAISLMVAFFDYLHLMVDHHLLYQNRELMDALLKARSPITKMDD